MKFAPFSHIPGTKVLLPCSQLFCEIYPALIRVYELQNSTLVAENPLSISGPVEQFTVMQNLEKGFIEVSGKSQKGFFRYELYPSIDSFGIRGKNISFEKMVPPVQLLPPGRERLHLGSHKKQEFPHLPLRSDLKEILPLWFWLSQTVPHIPSEPAIYEGKSLFCTLSGGDVAKNYLTFFQAAFTGLFVPRTKDFDHQGFQLPVVSDERVHPLLLLQESYSFIRQLFFQQEGKCLSFLPKLPGEFHCGMLTSVKTEEGHQISIEWTKHTVRRIFIEAACDDEVCITLQKEIKQARVRSEKRERGIRILNGGTISIAKGKKYLIDNFTK